MIRTTMPAAVLRVLVSQSVRFARGAGDALRAIVPQLLSLIEQERAGRRTDADAPEVLRNAMTGVLDLSAIRAAAAAAARGVDRHQLGQLRRQVRAAVGVDVTTGDATIPTLIRHFADEYTGLIVDIPDEVRRRAASIVAAGISGSQTAATIASDLERVARLAPRRAQLIARDQLGKLHGAINGARQRDLGVTEYVWRTVHDRRVRGTPGGAFPRANPSHYARDGKTFRWAAPPSDGHPGEAVLCRCTAEPVLDGLLDLERDVTMQAPPIAAPNFSILPIGLEPVRGFLHRTIEVTSQPAQPIARIGLEVGTPAPLTPPPAPTPSTKAPTLRERAAAALRRMTTIGGYRRTSLYEIAEQRNATRLKP